MKDFQFTLASNKAPKLNCPECGKKKHWQRYIDTRTGDVLPPKYGRCDNESKCGAWNSPYDDDYGNSETGYLDENNLPVKRLPGKKTTAPVFIPADVLTKTLCAEDYDKNIFIQNLLTSVPYPFDVKDVERVVSQYYLGTITQGYLAGGITFPYIDRKSNIRAVQVKKFDENNSTIATGFLHSLLERHLQKSNKPLPGWLKSYKDQDLKVSCLFGEHLLPKYLTNPVALVEAPKTAIYGTLYFGFPEKISNLLWLAVYNKSAFTFDRLKALQGRVVLVFPDLSKEGNTYAQWYEKALEFEDRLPGTHFNVSDLLEKHAPEPDRYEGKDIADYLITLDWRKFRKQPSQDKELVEPESQPGINDPEEEICEKSEKCEASETIFLFNHPRVKETTEDWGGEIKELRSYFAQCSLPSEPFMLDQCTKIVDIRKFIEANLATMETFKGMENGKPAMNRLKKLKLLLTKKH